MSHDRPVIGICAALEQARWGVWDLPAMVLPADYLWAIQRAGGLALMIPPDPAFAEHAGQLLDQLHGLVLAGGSDIDPASYGAEPHPATNGTVPERDASELALTRAAIARDMPVLGICRGMQLINVALGGSLHQHVPDLVGHGDHRRTPGSFDGADHDVHLQPGSLAAAAAGEELHGIKSHHHQAIDRIGEGLEVTGSSALDPLPEAVESPRHRFLLGVQWHPEADESSRVIAALVAEARDYRAARAAASQPLAGRSR
jgi:putative glutamine amidotransferase